MMFRLVCTFVVRQPQSQGFSPRGPYDVKPSLRLGCSQATKSGVFPSRPIRCLGWSAPLLFASNEVRGFCVEAHMMLRRVCAFVVRKQQRRVLASRPI